MCAHCNLTKSCARCKLLACSYLGLPSPLRHPLKASTSCYAPNTIASCALSSLLLGPWRSKLYSTWAGFEFAGTSSSRVSLSMLFHLSSVPPPFPLPPSPVPSPQSRLLASCAAASHRCRRLRLAAAAVASVSLLCVRASRWRALRACRPARLLRICLAVSWKKQSRPKKEKEIY